MRSEDLDRALGATPQSFADRMDQTLHDLKEEKQVKRVAFRTVLIASLIILALCTTAFALVSQGLTWYYNHRFTAYQEHEPEKYDAIMKNIQTELPQQSIPDPNIHIAVDEAAWIPEQNLLVVSVIAAAAQPDVCELHPMWNLDADGYYVGSDTKELEEDEEARSEHWLWTRAGYGPVDEMVAPGKKLLLMDVNELWLGDVDLMQLSASSVDTYVTEEGAVHTVLEANLELLKEDFIVQAQQQLEKEPDSVYWALCLDAAQKLQALLRSTDSLELTLTYVVTDYTEDDYALYTGGRKGELTFALKIR